MIIGVDIREWQPGRHTGIGRFLEEFIRAATVARPLDRFILIGDETCEILVQAGNVEVVRIPGRWTLWWDQVALPRAIARANVSVFYSPFIKVPLLASVPVVSTFHDLTFFLLKEYNQSLKDVAINAVFRVFCKLVVRRAAAVMVDSEASACDVREMFGVSPAKLRVIPLATSPCFHPNGNHEIDGEVLERHGLAKEYVLYVGGFAPHKNVANLVLSHRDLPQPLRDRHPLVLVGNGTPWEREHRLRASVGDGTIRILGTVSDADLPSLYRGAALFAFPSRYEGFGFPVLEAMACGVPVLCSTTPALVELTGTASLHVAPDDRQAWTRALVNVLTDATRREKLAADGLARSFAYSRERMALAILKLLEEAGACRF